MLTRWLQGQIGQRQRGHCDLDLLKVEKVTSTNVTELPSFIKKLIKTNEISEMNEYAIKKA